MSGDTAVPAAARDSSIGSDACCGGAVGFFFYIALSFVFVGCGVALEGRVGLGLDDEGFLWYGVQRTMEGDAPLRDFQSYDPGRYLWCSWGSRLFGEGILGVRGAVAVFQVGGLALGLLCLRRLGKSSRQVIGAALLLVWMHPRHKLFEPTIAMAAVFVGTILLRSPTAFRHFIAGVFIGVAAFFGRNHGLYCLLGLGCAALLARYRGPVHSFKANMLSMAVGLGFGISPFIAMTYLFPGFGPALVQSLAFHISGGAVNLALPVPWPWKAAQGSAGPGAAFPAHGILLVIVPLFYLSVVAALLWVKRIGSTTSAPVASAALIGIPYLHHAFARADLSHLAQAIHPFLIGVLCLPSLARGKPAKTGSFLLVALVVVLSLFSIVREHPAYQRWQGEPSPYVRVKVQGDDLWVSEATADLINGLYTMERKYFSKGGEVLAVPHLPGAYALLGRKSPLWQTYFFFPEREEKQKEMIRQIEGKGVMWVIMGEGTLDGREDLRFKNTHALVWRHIRENFEPVEGEALPGGYQLYRRRV